jgi:hypothetical protein
MGKSHLIFIAPLVFLLTAFNGPNFPDSGVITRETDSFYDAQIDYSKFPGRVTDKDRVGNILKIESESKNVKFFRAGDFVQFWVSTYPDTKACEGHVRGTEKNYFIIYVKDLNECWHYKEYFRRGNLLIFKSKVLAKRVKEASYYRLVLIQKRKDFMNQLNDKNHFLWSFTEHQVQKAAEFDRRINKLKREKQRAMAEMLLRKKESSILQRELIKKLDEVDVDLDFFRVDRQELVADRWIKDRDVGKPTVFRPQSKKLLKGKRRRWHQPGFSP